MPNILQGLNPYEIAQHSPLAQGNLVPQAPPPPGPGQRIDQGFSTLMGGMPGGQAAALLGAHMLSGGGLHTAMPQAMQMQSFKQRKQAREEVSKIAKDILGNLDVDQDGIISPAERQIGNAARTAMAAPDPNEGLNILHGIYQTRAQMALPQQAKPLSPVGKLAADLQAGVISSEQFQKAYEAIGSPETQVNINQAPPKPPSGYYYTGDPSAGDYGLAPLPGGPGEARTPEEAAKEQMLQTAVNQLPDIQAGLFNPDGSVNRANVLSMQAIPGIGKGIPGTPGRALAAQYEAGIQAITRGETGAAMPPSEVENTRERFMPKAIDDDRTIAIKYQMFSEFLQGNLKLVRLDKGGDPVFDSSAFDAELQKRLNEDDWGIVD